jgi:hypothetical protein
MKIFVARPGRKEYIEGLFRIASLQRHTGYRDMNCYCLLTLHSETQSFGAIAAGKQRLAPGQLVSVRGCLLTRGDCPVLVISSLKILALCDMLSVFPECF